MKRPLAGLLAACAAVSGLALTTTQQAHADDQVHYQWRGWVAMEETYDSTWFGVNSGQHVARVLYQDNSRTSMATTWQGDSYWQYTHNDIDCPGGQAHEFSGHG